VPRQKLLGRIGGEGFAGGLAGEVDALPMGAGCGRVGLGVVV
jgi:hypothetical protein